MTTRCHRLASSPGFQNGILAVIVGNAILIGLETSPALWVRYGGLFAALNVAVGSDAIAERLAVIRDSLAAIEAQLRNTVRPG